MKRYKVKFEYCMSVPRTETDGLVVRWFKTPAQHTVSSYRGLKRVVSRRLKNWAVLNITCA